MNMRVAVRVEAGLLVGTRRRAREENRTPARIAKTVSRQRVAGTAAPAPASIDAEPPHATPRMEDRTSHVA